MYSTKYMYQVGTCTLGFQYMYLGWYMYSTKYMYLNKIAFSRLILTFVKPNTHKIARVVITFLY
jgi:hypothetical protein